VRVRVAELLESDLEGDIAGGERLHEDAVAAEEPLEIRLSWPSAVASAVASAGASAVASAVTSPVASPVARRAWVTMRTPGHDFELATGWAVHEGLVAPDGLAGVAYCTDTDLTREQEFNVVTVTTTSAVDLEHRHAGWSSGSSACGVCGKDSIEAALKTIRGPRWEGALPGPHVVRRLPALLREEQSVFARTGGVHAAGLFTADGDRLVVREDVGRHNAVDKVTGARVLVGRSTSEACLVVSGRAGFELVQKAVAAGIGSLVAVGAPSALAVHLATQAGLRLYGFTRSDRTVRYT
jgi:FdhD protein